ncbi:GTP-binding protein [Virgibacillus phasianinus]|uniref:GTP-binding protein n=1 Tax=Virgibacillus phasianinus TaxID=2017483 RepID=A0A220TYN7_9BACI|nr:putative glycoside hydrolase [Virgibacillus phasianinus]ASK60801.1 GTP-binding protein [Virgibacillus phasianinus]
MGKTQFGIMSLMGILLLGLGLPMNTSASDEKEVHIAHSHQKLQTSLQPIDLSIQMKRFTYDAGLNFEYPEAVRGIYVTGPSAGGKRFEKLTGLVENTELNSMVIDIKDGSGHLMFQPKEGSPFADIGVNYIDDPRKMLEQLEKKGIYPIARIVVFKDADLAEKHPEWSFKENGKVWTNGKGDAFVSPFQKEVWKHNVEIAKMAAELGFQEIQFDYVRFPEGFEDYDEVLDYNLGDYTEAEDNVHRRVQAVTDFVSYAKEELESYGVKVGVDIFGYAATIPAAPGIGQNFSKISENVDVISSMIYPSHWTSYFGIEKPDMHPYKLVSEYAKVENQVLSKLKDPPTSRPWIQDFEAPWLYSGATKQYGKAEVEAQIKALKEHNINEFLLWNAGNEYTNNVDYTPLDK